MLCKFYQQGHCKVGEDCDFLHPGINGPSRPSRFTSRFSSPPPSTGRTGGVGRVNSPLKDNSGDDNWEVSSEMRDEVKPERHPPTPDQSPTATEKSKASSEQEPITLE